jgi:hypothetical protein
MLEAARERLVLPTPVFDVTKTRIVTSSSEASGSGTREDWAELETSALKSWDRKGKKPQRLLADDTRLSASVESELIECLRGANSADLRPIPRRTRSDKSPQLSTCLGQC